MGWFSTFYPVRLESSDDLGTTLKVTKERLRSIPHKGLGYGALFGYKDLPKILFNYLGQFEGSESGFWHLSHEESGLSVSSGNKDAYVMSINGQVSDGQLRFWLRGRVCSLTMETLARSLEESLQKIIHYARGQKRSYLTASDVDNIIEQKYLDELQRDRVIDAVYLANSLQQGFIYHALSQGDEDDAYRVQLVWDYETSLDKERLRQAWMHALKKYSSLRMRFGWSEDLVQIIDKEGELDWRFIDLSCEKDVSGESIRKIQEEDRREV